MYLSSRLNSNGYSREMMDKMGPPSPACGGHARMQVGCVGVVCRRNRVVGPPLVGAPRTEERGIRLMRECAVGGAGHCGLRSGSAANAKACPVRSPAKFFRV